ncbi:unnamed protein product [Meloidogyne enterolobii]|uniref:Uncharacterized protein n=1 Tax=Meloidogyne enterolobii TaxID=390850 RepID=A0ACB0Z625_MELEN
MIKLFIRIFLFPLLILFFEFIKVEALASVLISSPFDNFRIECPQTSGAQRLAIRMVESQGQKRQDTVFVLSCQQIGELYPWLEIPEELADQEHEECHYTQQFDILLDKQMNWTCSEREYLAGIARLSDTRIQLECCKLRTRNEGNCVEYDYEKPAGSGARVEIEYQGKLINALAVYGDLIRVRFCDLSPRPIDDIMAETTKTTPTIAIAHAVTSKGNSGFPLRPPTNSVGFSQRIEVPSLLNDPRTIAKQRATAIIALQNQLSNSPNVPPPINEELPPANLADGVDEAFSIDGAQQHNERENFDQEIKQNMENRNNAQVVEQHVEAVQQQVQSVHPQTSESIQSQVHPDTQEAKINNEEVQKERHQVQAVQEQNLAAYPEAYPEASQQRTEIKVQDKNIRDKDIEQQTTSKPVINVESMLEMSPINIKKSTKPEQPPITSEGQEQQNTERNKNAEIASPRIKVYGHNPFKTIQFGRILQAVGERKKELAVKILRHHKNPPDHVQSLEYGREQKHDEKTDERLKQEQQELVEKQQTQNEQGQIQNEKQENQQNNEQTNEPKQHHSHQQDEQKQEEKQEEKQDEQKQVEKHEEKQDEKQHQETQQIKEEEQNKKEKQTPQHLENSISKALAAKKQIYEPIKSNLLLRRKGMREHTFTLTPPRPVDVSAGISNGIEDRERAELTIQRRVDAIRAVEKRLQVKTIQIPREEGVEIGRISHADAADSNSTENIIAAKQSDWENNSETTDQISPKISNSDSGDGEAMHRILFGEPVQITPKNVSSKFKEANVSQALEQVKTLEQDLNKLENKQPKTETINLSSFPNVLETTQSPAAIWWEPMVVNTEQKQQNQKAFLPTENRPNNNRKQVNDQLDFATVTASDSLDNEANETTPLPFTIPADGPVAQEVRENALLAQKRVEALPKNKLRIFSINYGNPGWRKLISEISNEGKMEDSDNENNVANTTLTENLNETNTSTSEINEHNSEANLTKENTTNEVLSLRKSLPIYTLEWEKDNKQHQQLRNIQPALSDNKTVSPAQQSVETLFPTQLESGNIDNLSLNESKSGENTRSNSSKSNSKDRNKKLPPPPTSEEFADVMLREIDDQEKVPFSFSPHNATNTTTIPQLNFPRQFDDAKTSKRKEHHKAHTEENNDENFADYFVDELNSENNTHAFLSRRSTTVGTENQILVDGVKIFKNETTGEINEKQGEKKKRKRKKKKLLEGIEENNRLIPPTTSLATSEKLPPLDAFPSPPPLDSRGKLAILAAASSKQFAQLPPSSPQALVKQQQQKKFQNIDYKRELEQRLGSEHKTAETLAIELAKASNNQEHPTLNTAEENNTKKNVSKKYKNRRKQQQEQQQENKHEEREENVELKHESQQQHKQIKEYRSQQFAALIATTSRPMRMGVDYEVADDEGNAEREITNYHTTITQFPKTRTTRLPLFKRRQLDRIALEVFGPSAFDPSIEHPQIDVALLSRRPLNQQFRHKRPPTRVEGPVETSTGMMGLPDEETDISPFDAERAQLLERLRHNHKNRQEEHIETFDDTEATQHEAELFFRKFLWLYIFQKLLFLYFPETFNCLLNLIIASGKNIFSELYVCFPELLPLYFPETFNGFRKEYISRVICFPELVNLSIKVNKHYNNRREENLNRNTKKNQLQNNFENSFNHETTISLPNFENRNQNFIQKNFGNHGHFERVESRFEKASPFDDRHEEEHFEDEEEPRTMASKNAEIRRKPSLTSVPFIPPTTNFKDEEISSINNEAAVKRSIASLQVKKDGSPLFSPKDNKPMMKMPSENIEKMIQIDERNDISTSETQSLEDILVPMGMNETTKNYLEETTQPPTETTEQTTKQKEKQNKNLNKHKNKQNINTEGSGNNYWRFFAEPNIYRTTTEFPLEQQQEEEAQFYNADKYFHLPNRRQNNKQRENENGQ